MTSERDVPSIRPAVPLHSAPVLEAQRGSQSAREQLLVEGLPGLRRWAHGRLSPELRNCMDTCDLAQEVALLTLTHLSRFTPEHDGSMKGFLRRVAINRLLDEFRRTRRRPKRVALDDAVPSGSIGPLECAVQAEERRRCRSALSRLRTKDQQLLHARFDEEASLATIAARFGLPSTAAAGMALVRAERRLKREMASGTSRRGALEASLPMSA
jgi:RNA polymerase sigma factor (sigma-70 family)